MEPDILSLPREQFLAALDELQLDPARRDDLVRQYRRASSPFAPIYGLLERVAAEDADQGMQRAAMLPVARPEGMSVAEAVRSGEAQFALPQSLFDMLGGSVGAVDAPSAAAQGLIPSEDMVGEAFGTGGLAMGAGGAFVRPEDSLGMGGTTMPWRERIEASIPRDWLDEKFDKPQWNPISNVASNRPESDMVPVQTSTNTLAPERRLSLEGLLGSTLIPALGDRSVAGVNIEGVGNLSYAAPIRSLGGADFMREQGTGLWANDFKPARDLAETAQRVIDQGGDPLMVYTAMGPQSGDFSTMMAEAILNQIDPQRIDPRVAAEFDERARQFVPSFQGITAPNLRERLFNDHTGSQRWALWQALDRAKFRDAGLPDVGMARRAITDPRLLNAIPFDSGLTVGRMTGGLLDNLDVEHPTYNTQIGGDYLGGIDPVAGPIIWRDFFEGRRAAGASAGSDQRSFLMNSPRMAQRVDQQMIDEAGEMQEYLRGINDPSSPFRLWLRQ